MVSNHLKVFIVSLGFASLIVSPHPSYAYIDPNTGGFFFTSVLPFVYALLGAVVIFWKRIVGVIKSIFSRNKQ